MRQINLSEVKQLAEQATGNIDRIFLHWSAGHYGQIFDDYHFCIDKDGEIYVSVDDLTTKLAHTWHQNTGSIAISLLCCVDANTVSFGNEPPTISQIETMAQAITVLCGGLQIPIDYDHVRTHAEQADIDDYGPATTCERWDLWMVKENQTRGSGGEVLRGKAIWYKENGVGV